MQMRTWLRARNPHHERGAGILLRHHGKSLISCVSPGSKQGTVGSVVLAPSMPTCLRIPPVILCVGVVPKAWRWHGSHEPENAGKPIFPGVSPESKQGMVGGIAFFPASAIAPAAPCSTGCIRPPKCADRKCASRAGLACSPSVPGMTSAASVAGMWRRVRMPACMVGKHECDEIRNPWKTNVSGCVT